eukprot:UN30786
MRTWSHLRNQGSTPKSIISQSHSPGGGNSKREAGSPSNRPLLKNYQRHVVPQHNVHRNQKREVNTSSQYPKPTSVSHPSPSHTQGRHPVRRKQTPTNSPNHRPRTPQKQQKRGRS